MKLFNFGEKPIRVLQAELKALVNRIVAEQNTSQVLMERYERILREIYNRGEEPEILLTRKRKEEK